jgi:hypothetical protein
MRSTLFIVTLLSAMALFLSSCIQPIMPPEAEIPQADEIQLGETLEFPGFAYRIDHPAGWTLYTCPPAFALAADSTDAALFCASDAPPNDLVMGFDHRDLNFMRTIGLPAEATLDDLVALNQREFDQEILDEADTTIFGVPARRTRFADDEGAVGIVYAGFLDDEAFLLGFTAPSTERLEEHMATIEAMVASLQATEE